MDSVLTLIGDAKALVDPVRQALENVGGRVGKADWLAPGEACDLPFAGLEPAVAEAAARRALAGRPADLAAQPRAGRRKRLLLADLESTVIENEMLDELAAMVGVGERVAAITARAMNGELDFRAALDERVALLAGQPAALLERVRERVAVDPGAPTLIATLGAHGVETALVSGGFHVFADDVAERLGFDHVAANRLEMAHGRIAGRVREPILDRDAKLRLLEEHCRRLGIGPEDAAAVGDGANDLAMLTAAGLGVAYHAKATVAAAARFRVDHGDLRALLYFLGYRRDQWTSTRDASGTNS